MYTMLKKPKISRVAAVQMCSSHLVEENLATAAHLIENAAKNDARLIVLPEMFAIMGLKGSDKVSVREPFGQGKIQSFLSEQAIKNKAWIVGGTIPIACKDDNKIRASSLVFNDKGKVVARYDKMHLFDVTVSENEVYKESDSTEPGSDIVVVETPVGRLGLAVCYDVRFPELFRCLLNRGAEIISLPSAFTVKTGAAHWELLARSRAVENFCYVIGACQGGAHTSGRATYGKSIIIEPWGEVTAKKEDVTPGVIFSDVDLAHLAQVRKSIPIMEHRKIFFDDPEYNENISQSAYGLSQDS